MTERIKAKIVKVGTMEGDWVFDCENGAVANEIDENGVQYIAGYTINELAQIVREQSE